MRFSTAFAVFLCTISSLPGEVVGYWRFEEGTTNRTASGVRSIVDSSGKGNHGTVFGSPIYRPSRGPGSLELEFNGSNSSVTIHDDPAFHLSESLTIEAWVTIHSYSSGPNNYIVFRGDTRAGLDPYWLAYKPNGTIAFHIASGIRGRNAELRTPQAVLRNRRIHVAGTLDHASGEMKLYINHELVASTQTSIRPAGALSVAHGPAIGIGNVGNNTHQEFFRGRLDEVRISNTALSPTQFISSEERTPYDEWVLAQGADPKIELPESDKSNDGFANLLHFALGVPLDRSIPLHHPRLLPEVDLQSLRGWAIYWINLPSQIDDGVEIAIQEHDGEDWQTIARKRGSEEWDYSLPQLLVFEPPAADRRRVGVTGSKSTDDGSSALFRLQVSLVE